MLRYKAVEALTAMVSRQSETEQVTTKTDTKQSDKIPLTNSDGDVY